MSESPVRFGLIGFGAFGRHHAHAIARTEGARLAAIAESSEETQAAARHAYPNAEVVGDYRELLRRDDLDVIDIVVPGHVHHEVASAVLSSGKHLLLEKPMCLTIKQCDDILRLAKENDRLLAVGHELRLSSLWGKVKEFLVCVGITALVVFVVWMLVWG